MSRKIFKTSHTIRYYLNGRLHREGAPAIKWHNGSEEWFTNGLRHRTDGPASSWSSGAKEWWINGVRHRTTGPAIEWYDDSVFLGWFINGNDLTKEITQWFKETSFNQDYNNWTREETVQFKLVWG